MAIKVFFHICCITRAEYVVKNYVRSIYFSGLYDDCDEIYCYLSGEIETIERVRSMIGTFGKKFKIVKCVPNDETYERLTLEDIHNHVEKDDKILYIHSKGIRNEYQNDNELLVRLDDWADTMLYYLVRYYRKCLEKLDSFDTVGINLGHLNHKHYHWSGNFWWVRGDYFLTLPHKINQGYHDPELSFMFLNNPRYFEIHNMGKIDCYKSVYESFKYIDSRLE